MINYVKNNINKQNIQIRIFKYYNLNLYYSSNNNNSISNNKIITMNTINKMNIIQINNNNKINKNKNYIIIQKCNNNIGNNCKCNNSDLQVSKYLNHILQI